MNVKRRSVFFARFSLALVLIAILIAARPTAQAQSVSPAPELKVFPLGGLFAPLADACTDSCAQTQADAIAFCDATYDLAFCGGDPK